jgi:hypothetical protein
LVATRRVLFPSLLNLVSNWNSIENLCNYMNTWLKYILFVSHYMSFLSQPIEFSVKYHFLVKIYANYMKNGWNMSYLVTTRCDLASPHVLH